MWAYSFGTVLGPFENPAATTPTETQMLSHVHEASLKLKFRNVPFLKGAPYIRNGYRTTPGLWYLKQHTCFSVVFTRQVKLDLFRNLVRRTWQVNIFPPPIVSTLLQAPEATCASTSVPYIRELLTEKECFWILGLENQIHYLIAYKNYCAKTTPKTKRLVKTMFCLRNHKDAHAFPIAYQTRLF